LAVNQPYKDDVVIYTDEIGIDILRKNLPKLPRTSFVVVDYNKMNFDKRYWNFPKLFTYSLQDDFFIHIDFDVFLTPNFITQLDYSADIVTEKLRNFEYASEFDRFNSNGKIPKKLICSGILGGSNNGIFRENFSRGSVVCIPTKSEVTFENLVAIEEYSLTKIAVQNNLTIQELDENSFVHFQGKNKHARFGDLIKNYKI
jgi:hypothetical protein